MDVPDDGLPSAYMSTMQFSCKATSHPAPTTDEGLAALVVEACRDVLEQCHRMLAEK